MNIHLSKYQKSLFYEIFINKEYNKLDHIICNSSIIFDIGSNIGLFSLYVLSKRYTFGVKIEGDFLVIPEDISLKNDLKIHLFEPNHDIFVLSESVLSIFYSLTYQNNFGLAFIPGEYEFIIPEIDCQGSLYESFLTNKKGNKIKVLLKNLGEYVDEYDIKTIDLLKMDIEGAEFEVLLSLEEKYFKRIKVLFFEYHLLSPEFENQFEVLLKKLKGIYQDVEVIKGKYTEKIGYIICK